MHEALFKLLGTLQKQEQVNESSNKAEQAQRAATASVKDLTFKGLEKLFGFVFFS